MMTKLHFGSGQAAEVEIPANVFVPTVQAERLVPVDDVRRQALRALNEPVDFPPLSRAVVPGDQVVIPVDFATPQLRPLVAGVVDALLAANVEPDGITILCDRAVESPGWAGFAADSVHPASVVVHDPLDDRQLSPLGITKSGRSIYLNRLLCEADVVLPVGCSRPPDVAATFGAGDTIYPRFADGETISRYESTDVWQRAESDALRDEATEVAWLLGVSMIMQVVPGPAGSVGAVIAGAPAAAAAEAQRVSGRSWTLEASRRASLVIATLTGDSSQQTWDNLARALAAAERVADDDGAVVVCCEIDQPPGPQMKLAPAAGEPAGDELWRQESSAENWSTTLLARSLERGPVYLMSKLDDDVVEEMGLAPVHGMAELSRLAQRQRACVVLDDAQFVAPCVAGEDWS